MRILGNKNFDAVNISSVSYIIYITYRTESFNYMADNCFILFIKGKVYRQTIGIPMGIDPAPFIAN